MNPEKTAPLLTFRQLIRIPLLPIALFTLCFSLFLALATPTFLTVTNWMNISRQVAILGIMAVGMNLVILGAGIDLSVGSILGLALCVAGTFIELGWPAVLVMVIIAALATFLGLVNGTLIASMNVPPIIATLGTLSIYRGLAYIYTHGYWICGLPYSYLRLGRGYNPLIIWSVVAVLGILAVRKSVFGRHVYAVGGNEQAARYAGVNTHRIKLITYAISGLTAGLGAVVFAGRTGVIQPTAGIGYEFQAIAAVVVGGTSIFGGEGRISGTVVGTLLLGIILNGLTLLGISAYWQGTVTGTVIIAAVLLDSVRRTYG